MPSVTVYASSESGHIRSRNATYSTARSGGGTLTPSVDGATMSVGQGGGGIYDVWEAFLAFDLASAGIPDGATITAAVLGIYATADDSGADFTIGARDLDYGATLTSADWVAGASLSSTGTERATLDTTPGISTSAYVDFTDAAMVALVEASLSGTLRLVLYSSRTVSGSAPIGAETVTFTGVGGSDKPRLVIDYTATEEHDGDVHDSATVTEDGAGTKGAAATITDGLTAADAIAGNRGALGVVSDGAVVDATVSAIAEVIRAAEATVVAMPQPLATLLPDPQTLATVLTLPGPYASVSATTAPEASIA